MSHVSRALRAFAPHVPCVIRGLVHHVPRALRAQVFYVPRALCDSYPMWPRVSPCFLFYSHSNENLRQSPDFKADT